MTKLWVAAQDTRCRSDHCGCKKPSEPKINESAAKFQAGILLCDIQNGIRIPTRDEWIGFNLLERDGEI